MGCLGRELQISTPFERQKPIPVVYEDGKFAWLPASLDEHKIVAEAKAMEQINPIHQAIVLTYLQRSDKRIGLRMNFNLEFQPGSVQRRHSAIYLEGPPTAQHSGRESPR